MNKTNVEKFMGKRVFLLLKNGFKYSGVIGEVYDDSFSFIDRYSCKMLVSLDDVIVIREADENGEE